MTCTYTYALMEVSQTTYDEIRAKLLAADGYEDAVDDQDLRLNMRGLALTPAKDPTRPDPAVVPQPSDGRPT